MPKPRNPAARFDVAALAAFAGPAPSGIGVDAWLVQVPAGLGSATWGVLALLLFLLAGRGRCGTARWPLVLAGATALTLALARAGWVLGLGPRSMLLPAETLGLAAALTLLFRLPRWLAEPSALEAQAITRSEAAEGRLKTLARDLEAQMTTRTAELQESEARLQGFIRHASVAIAFKGLDGRILLANQRAEELIALSRPEVPSRDLWPPEVVGRLRKLDEAVLATREAAQTEVEVPLPGGGGRTFLVQKFPLMDTIGHCWGLGVIATDITARKQAEKAHLQHQKLESIGLLAGGIAHDFNNLLGAMSGNLELALLEPGLTGPVLAYCRNLEELIGRASSLVAQILAYAGKGKAQIQPMDLNDQVEGMIRLLRASLSRKAALRWEPAPGLPGLEGDPAQIQQVILNLVLNASEALADRGGTITLRTGLEHLSQTRDNGACPGEALRPGPYLTLEVADDGVGIPPAVRERIFDPFYTTKFTGRGLGLSVVQGILRSHHGGIRVSSVEGEGTSFKLLFPALVAAPPPPVLAAPAPEAGFETVRGWGAVLVVDDEEALRATAGGALCRLGFTVLEAADGVEALAVFKAHQDRIRLILMDLIMPRMDGEEAFRELRRAGARVPIILTSGLGPDEALTRFLGKGLAAFLPKPYRLQGLVEAVQAALGEDGAGAQDGPRVAPVAWVSAFETGHTVMDAQHRRLVLRFNALLAQAQGPQGDPEAAEEALHDFIGATVAHFAIEEGLMADAGYAGLEDHRAIHAHLTNEIQDLARDLHRGQVGLTPPILNFLEGWLLCHIQFEDRQLARHLQAHRRDALSS